MDAPRHRSVRSFCVGIAFFWAALYIYVPILPVYARSLGASLSLVGLIVASYGVVQLLLRIPLGVASDRLGRRKPFVLVGFVTVALSCTGLAVAGTPEVLLVSRALAGLAACSWVTSSVLFAGYFPPQESVRAASVLNFFSSGGRGLATIGGGILAERFGWVSTFWAGTGLALLGLAVMAHVGEGTTVAVRRVAWRDVWGVAKVPLLLVSSALATLSQYSSFATTYGFIPVYAVELGASRADLGWLTAAVQIPYTLVAMAAGRLSEHVGERVVVVSAALLVAVTTLVTPFIQRLGLLALSRVGCGVGEGLIYPTLMGLSIKVVPQSQRASAMGIFQAVYGLGMFGGPAISGLIADHLGLRAMFLATGVLCLGMALVALRGLRVREWALGAPELSVGAEGAEGRALGEEDGSGSL